MVWSKINLLSLILGWLLFSGGTTVSTAPPSSEGIFFGSVVPSGQVVDNNAILTGNQVAIDGTVNGDVLAIGTDVTVNGTVQGSLLAFAQKVTVNGTVSGSVYAAALELDIGPTAVVNQNVFYGGMNLISSAGSQIKRDLYAGSVGAQLAGTVNRHVSAVIGPMNLMQALVDALGGKIVLPDIRPLIPRLPNSSGPGATGQTGSAGLAVWMDGSIQGVRASLPQPVQWQASESQQAVLQSSSQSQIDTANILVWLEDRLREFVTIALIGLIAIWLLPKLFYIASEKIQQKPFSSAGIGLFELVLALNMAGVLVLFLALVFVVGLWLGPRTTWAMSWALWGAGFFSTGLAVVLLWLFVFFVSKSIAAYFGGKFILSRLAPDAVRHRVLPLLLGLFIYTLIASIPLIGWVFEVAMIALGLGAAWFAYRSRSEAPHPVVDAQPADQKITQEVMDH